LVKGHTTETKNLTAGFSVIQVLFFSAKDGREKQFYTVPTFYKRERDIVGLVNYAFTSLISANLPCGGNQEGHGCVLILN